VATVIPTAVAAIIAFTSSGSNPPREINNPYAISVTSAWPDKPDYPHMELAEAAMADPFVPTIITGAPSRPLRVVKFEDLK
jgi:hypothetical protein